MGSSVRELVVVKIPFGNGADGNGIFGFRDIAAPCHQSGVIEKTEFRGIVPGAENALTVWHAADLLRVDLKP